MDAYDQNKIPGPYGPLPAEFARTTEVKLPKEVKEIDRLNGLPASNIVVKPPAVGDLARMQVLFEIIRLKQGYDTLKPEEITDPKLIAPLVDEDVLGAKQPVAVA